MEFEIGVGAVLGVEPLLREPDGECFFVVWKPRGTGPRSQAVGFVVSHVGAHVDVLARVVLQCDTTARSTRWLVDEPVYPGSEEGRLGGAGVDVEADVPVVVCGHGVGCQGEQDLGGVWSGFAGSHDKEAAGMRVGWGSVCEFEADFVE